MSAATKWKQIVSSLQISSLESESWGPLWWPPTGTPPLSSGPIQFPPARAPVRGHCNCYCTVAAWRPHSYQYWQPSIWNPFSFALLIPPLPIFVRGRTRNVDARRLSRRGAVVELSGPSRNDSFLARVGFPCEYMRSMSICLAACLFVLVVVRARPSSSSGRRIVHFVQLHHATMQWAQCQCVTLFIGRHASLGARPVKRDATQPEIDNAQEPVLTGGEQGTKLEQRRTLLFPERWTRSARLLLQARQPPHATRLGDKTTSANEPL